MLLKNGGYDTNTETARSFRDSLEFGVFVYEKNGKNRMGK